MTTVRSNTPPAWPCMCMLDASRAGVIGAIAVSRLNGGDAPRVCFSGRHTSWERRSHVVIVLVVQHVADEQDDGLFSVILPPVRGAARLRPDLAGLVRDRDCAIAGVFDDLALGDVDDRGTVGMAVPGHDAAGL